MVADSATEWLRRQQCADSICMCIGVQALHVWEYSDGLAGAPVMHCDTWSGASTSWTKPNQSCMQIQVYLLSSSFARLQWDRISGQAYMLQHWVQIKLKTPLATVTMQSHSLRCRFRRIRALRCSHVGRSQRSFRRHTMPGQSKRRLSNH